MGNGASAPRNAIVVQPQNHTADFTRNLDHQGARYPNESHVYPSVPSAPPPDDSAYEIDEGIETALAPSCSQPVTRSKEASRLQLEPEKDLEFEVYHCLATGREYCLINSEGSRFYLDDWETGEWQPFPEAWLHSGYIESLHRVEDTEPADISVSDVRIEDRQTAPPDGHQTAVGDRMGLLQHPTRGQLATYFMEESRNVLCVFDASSGDWLKLPMCWELQTAVCRNLIRTVQEAVPDWTDTYEILGALRQCNYNVDEVITTYLSLIQDDIWAEQVRQGSDNGELFKHMKELEETLKIKEVELEVAQEKRKELEERLSSVELTNQLLETRVAKLQCDLRLAEEQLTAQPPPPKGSTSIPTPQRTPERLHVSLATAATLREATRSLSEDLLSTRKTLSRGVRDMNMVLKQAGEALRKMKSQGTSHMSELAELRNLYHKETIQRKLLYNKLQELRGNIRVFCRCRLDTTHESVVKVPSGQEIEVLGPAGERRRFEFDRVFGPLSTQEDVFQDTLPLITSCADGYNVCIMAYGQTGSGKTYTMMGPESNPGVNMRSIQELLKICSERENVDYTLSVSMVEVYNETLRDLLNNKPQHQLSIQTRGRHVVVPDLTDLPVTSTGDIKEIMDKGHANRAVGSTKMNTTSSRSHLLLVLHVVGADQVSRAVSRGTLTLVDLAGSERISKTDATGQRLVEAAAINKSLTALGQVFTALRTGAMHVPYRNSKLTQLLQGALGGDGKTCVFVNVSPAAENASETLSTLHFGAAAQQVELGKAVRHVVRPTPKHARAL